MGTLKLIVLVLHLLSFGAVFGLLIAQLKQAAHGKGQISAGLVHCGWALLGTGLLLVGLTYAAGGAPNNFKIAVKLAVLVIIMLLLFIFKKRQSVSSFVLGVLALLLVLNVFIAVLW